MNRETFEPVTETDLATALQEAVADVFDVESIRFDPRHVGVVRLYGHFLADSAEAYEVASDRFRTLGYVPMFREERGHHVIVAMPGNLPSQQPRVKVAAILFAITILSTLFSGMEWQPDRPIWQNVISGIPFALSLLAILLAHEMGHYLVARRLGVPVSLPYFIPMPINPLGTMGALIQMKAPPKNKRHLLAVGVAGPLAGLVVALPLLVLGLALSSIEPLPLSERGYLLEGNSLLYALLKVAMFGDFVPQCSPGTAWTFFGILQTALFGCPYGVGIDVSLHPIAFAGWAGLLVTGLNLIPAGTLDGGHVAYALLGSGARFLTWAMIVVMALLGLLWPGWFLWAGLIFLLGRRSATPLDDITRLKIWQVALGFVLLVVFVLTFVPVPLQFFQP